MYERHKKRVAFLVVYIKEAHPEDGWVLEMNREAHILVRDPVSLAEREAVASTCATHLDIRMPVVIDGAENDVARQYGGFPDRLYLIGKDGRIAFQGEVGPFGFKPQQLEQAIHSELTR